MSRLLIIAVLAITIGCSAAMKPDQAAKAIARQLNLPEKSVKVMAVSGSQGNVVADATLQVSFALQLNPQGEWEILRVKDASGWSPPDRFFALFVALW